MGLVLGWGICKKQLINVSFSHECFYLSISSFLPIFLKSINMPSIEDNIYIYIYISIYMAWFLFCIFLCSVGCLEECHLTSKYWKFSRYHSDINFYLILLFSWNVMALLYIIQVCWHFFLAQNMTYIGEYCKSSRNSAGI